MTLARARGTKKKCDDLFSLIVRARGACQRCAEDRYEQLQSAHIISRRYSQTRCDETNALCLCASCHHFFTDHPVEFGLFVDFKIGDLYWDLTARAQPARKFDWDAELERLRAIWLKIRKAA